MQLYITYYIITYRDLYHSSQLLTLSRKSVFLPNIPPKNAGAYELLKKNTFPLVDPYTHV